MVGAKFLLIWAILLSGCAPDPLDKREISRLSANADDLQKAVTTHYESLVVNADTPKCQYYAKANQDFWNYQQGQMRIIEARSVALNDKEVTTLIKKIGSEFARARSLEERADRYGAQGRIIGRCLDEASAMNFDRWFSGFLIQLKRRADLVR